MFHEGTDQNLPRSPTANALMALQSPRFNNGVYAPSVQQHPAATHNFPPTAVSAYAQQPSSVINLSHSNDVVIGPMTQYQAPVTIYQYMDATVESQNRSPKIDLGGTSNSSRYAYRSSHNNGNDKFLTPNRLTFIMLTILLIVAIGLGTYFGVQANQSTIRNVASVQDIFFGKEYDDKTLPNLGNGHIVIDRKQWGSSELGHNNKPLRHPIPYVLITHIGVQSEPCSTVYKCSIKMRTIQDSAIAEKKLPDLPANFYVSNDGYVYVGRGWDFVNSYLNNTLAVCMMGDYVRHEPDLEQLDAVQHLLVYGTARGFLAADYKLVAHNQTKKTSSPGVNVYKHIIKWPHWYPCGLPYKPKCGSEIGLPDVWDTRM